MGKHEVTVTMVFDDHGELQDVKPEGDAKAEKLGDFGEPIPVKNILEKDHSKVNFHSFFYEFGSPGCVTYKTRAGLIRICWPQG